MIVDQPGNDGLAFEIDLIGIAAREFRDLRSLADRDDAAVLDRNRLSDREAVVDRHDPAVDEYHVGLPRCENRRRDRKQQGQSCTAKDAKDAKENRIVDR